MYCTVVLHSQPVTTDTSQGKLIAHEAFISELLYLGTIVQFRQGLLLVQQKFHIRLIINLFGDVNKGSVY